MNSRWAVIIYLKTWEGWYTRIGLILSKQLLRYLPTELWAILIHTDMHLIHLIRIGNITSISILHLIDMDSMLSNYFLRGKHYHWDIHIQIDAIIMTMGKWADMRGPRWGPQIETFISLLISHFYRYDCLHMFFIDCFSLYWVVVVLNYHIPIHRSV